MTSGFSLPSQGELWVLAPDPSAYLEPVSLLVLLYTCQALPSCFPWPTLSSTESSLDHDSTPAQLVGPRRQQEPVFTSPSASKMSSWILDPEPSLGLSLPLSPWQQSPSEGASPQKH